MMSKKRNWHKKAIRWWIKEQYRTLESAMYGACDRTKVIEKGIPLFQRLDVEETTNEIKEMMK